MAGQHEDRHFKLLFAEQLVDASVQNFKPTHPVQADEETTIVLVASFGDLVVLGVIDLLFSWPQAPCSCFLSELDALCFGSEPSTP